jgi:hypothetical protein
VELDLHALIRPNFSDLRCRTISSNISGLLQYTNLLRWIHEISQDGLHLVNEVAVVLGSERVYLKSERQTRRANSEWKWLQ